jgi:hypothetical protein
MLATLRIRLELFDPQTEPLVVLVDVEDQGIHLVPLLVNRRGMGHSLRPRDVAHVDESVDPVLHSQKNAEVGDVADIAPNHGADGVTALQHFPGVGLTLFDSEGDPLPVGVEIQHHDLDLVCRRDLLTRVVHPLGPAHLRDVNEALDTRFEFDECPVVGDGDDLAVDARADRVLIFSRGPRVRLKLFETQTYALALAVEGEHLYRQFVGDVEHVRRVVDPAPAHVGNMQQTVDPPQVDEGPVIGNILDHALQDRPFLELFQGFFAMLLALFFEQNSTGKDDVAATAVELDDFELKGVSDELFQLAYRPEGHLRSGQKRTHADVHREPALDSGHDAALNHLVVLGRLADGVPDANLVRLVLGEDDHTILILELLDEVEPPSPLRVRTCSHRAICRSRPPLHWGSAVGFQ